MPNGLYIVFIIYYKRLDKFWRIIFRFFVLPNRTNPFRQEFVQLSGISEQLGRGLFYLGKYQHTSFQK